MSSLSGLGLPACFWYESHVLAMRNIAARLLRFQGSKAGHNVIPATHPGIEPGTKSLTGSCSTAELTSLDAAVNRAGFEPAHMPLTALLYR